jgi:hypothetical protein
MALSLETISLADYFHNGNPRTLRSNHMSLRVVCFVAIGLGLTHCGSSVNECNNASDAEPGDGAALPGSCKVDDLGSCVTDRSTIGCCQFVASRLDPSDPCAMSRPEDDLRACLAIESPADGAGRAFCTPLSEVLCYVRTATNGALEAFVTSTSWPEDLLVQYGLSSCAGTQLEKVFYEDFGACTK